METVKVNTSQHVDIDYPVAGVGERMAARLIDLAIFFGLYILFILIGLITAVFKSPAIIIVLLIIYGVAYVFYNLIYEIFFDGQSAGKRILKIKVVSLDGGQPSIGQYFIRWLFRLVDFALTGQIAGLICVAVSAKKQRIGDIVAGTTVIKTVARTGFEHIAFKPVVEEYDPVFQHVHELSDKDIELIHEVIRVYQQTGNYDVIRAATAKVTSHLSVAVPAGMSEPEFLQTVLKDYNYITSISE